jgi:penicillin-binding protein 1C
VKKSRFITLIILLIFSSIFVLPIFFHNTILLNPLGYSKSIFDRHGTLLRLTLSSDQKYRIHVPLTEISKVMIHETLNKEDKYFFIHPGVNPIALFRSFIFSVLGFKTGGASTITMQYARLRFDLSTKSVLGKIRQIFYALLIELHFTKNEILEAYFNIAPYGRNIEGIEAASRLYYGTKASSLLTPQAKKLVLLPQLPSARSKKLFADLASLPFEAPHFVDRILSKSHYSDRIETSLDLTQQKNSETLLHQFISRHSGKGVHNASVVIASVKDMSVTTYIGSADFFNTTIHGQVNGCAAKRSPGSSLKPFIYALAADKGFIHSETKLIDTNFNKSNYNPENFEKNFIGPISATDALVHSRNIPAIFLLNQISPELFRSFLIKTGVTKIKEPDFYGLSLALGGVEVSEEELVTLFGILAHLGNNTHLRFLKDLESNIDKQPLLSEDASYLILKMLSENPRPVSVSQKQHQEPPIAWKTGTSFGFRDAWATAIVGDSIVSVWIGNFDGTGNPVFLGRDLAGELLFTLIDGLSLNKKYPMWFNQRPNNISDVKVCSTSGELPESFCPHTTQSLFIAGVSPRKKCSVHREVYQQGVKHVVEVWSSDVLKLFSDGGIPRNNPTSTSHIGKPPLITSPQETLTYLLSDKNDSIPLSAVVDGDSEYVYWLVDDLPVARILKGEVYYWKPEVGEYRVTVTDEKGRTNSVKVRVSRVAAPISH